MRRIPLSLAVLCAALTAATALEAQAQAVDLPVSDGTARVIVKLKTDSPLLSERTLSTKARLTNRALALGGRLGLPMSAGPAVSEHAQVVVAAGVTSEELAQRLARESDVEYAVPDQRRRHFVAPNDPLYAAGVPGNGPAVGQWYLRAPEGEVQSSVNVELAWAITTGSPSVVVAVLDSGVRFDHPDLLAVADGGSLLPGYDMISDVNVSNDGNGRDGDASDPGDGVTQAELSQRGAPFFQCMPSPQNSSWHGTQVSGLIAARTNNGLGMASVGRNVRVLPVRVLGKCGGYDSDIIAGMRWAAGLAVPGVPANPSPAKVLNMSLGGDGSCGAAYQQAVTEIIMAGSVIVAAAGNSAGHAVSSPANCNGVIAVGALRHAGTKVGFSNLGSEITISAPGGNCINTTAGSPCLYPILTTSTRGVTTPGSPIYTDSFNPSLGTSFSTPLVAGTVALMLSAQPAMTPQQLKTTLQATARPFPTTGGDTTGGTPLLQCTAPQFNSAGTPVDQVECYCNTATCGAGMLDAGAAVLASSTGTVPDSIQAEGLWWNAPASSESGWGINLAHQGDVIFATWFTYDLTGSPWWLSMTAHRMGTNVYAGTLLETHGPAFSAVPFNPAQVTATAVGQGTLAFSDANNGSFNYTVNGITQTKSITRDVFGTLPTCTFGAQTNLALATNYQDLWWNAPARSESGWGINITEQSNIIFATWFTYDLNGNPVWLSLTANNTAPGVYYGTLNGTTGPAFNALPFNPADVRLTPVGTATLTFADGNNATFAYTVDGVSQTKSITRDVFRAPGTVCR